MNDKRAHSYGSARSRSTWSLDDTTHRQRQVSISILLLILRIAMIWGGAICLLVIAYSGSAASLAVRDWTLFRVFLGESVLIGYLSACTVKRFRFPRGSDLHTRQSSKALRFGLGTGLVLAVVCGAALVRSNPDRQLAALLSVVWAMLTFGFAGLMWSAYLGIKLMHPFGSSRGFRGVV